jgi:AhpD family alkylhydroperoxidase
MSAMLIEPPASIPLWLRPGLWLARKMTGKEPLPGRMLAWAPKVALGFGLFELCAPHAPHDLDARTLAAARIAASVAAGCPFCVDMNAATWKSAGLTEAELAALVSSSSSSSSLSQRERDAVEYARALSSTPVAVSAELAGRLRASFTPREIVVLAAAIAQVNAWARFNHGLGIPAAGFFDDSACAVRLPAPHT